VSNLNPPKSDSPPESSKTSVSRREFGALAAGAAALIADPMQAAETSPSGNAPLDLAEWSYFWVGIERAELARGTVVKRQADVRRIPDPARDQAPLSYRPGSRRRGAREQTGWARPMAAGAGRQCWSNRAIRSTLWIVPATENRPFIPIFTEPSRPRTSRSTKFQACSRRKRMKSPNTLPIGQAA